MPPIEAAIRGASRTALKSERRARCRRRQRPARPSAVPLPAGVRGAPTDISASQSGRHPDATQGGEQSLELSVADIQMEHKTDGLAAHAECANLLMLQ